MNVADGAPQNVNNTTSGNVSDSDNAKPLPKAPHSLKNPPAAICIYIVGPSSSGKSTLCNAFAKDVGILPSIYVKEVARDVMRKHGFTREDVGTFEMQSSVMIAQLRAEKVALFNHEADSIADSPSTSRVALLSDRSAVDPIVYAASSMDAGVRDMSEKLRRDPEFEAVLPRYRASLFVVLTPVAEWIEDDGVRSLEDPWRYSDTLREVLSEMEIPFCEIGEEIRDIRSRVQILRRWASL